MADVPPVDRSARALTDNPEPMLQFFKYEHLPPLLKDASKLFCDLAEKIVSEFPRNPERTVALRKLLEAKDCAVRSLLYNMPTVDYNRKLNEELKEFTNYLIENVRHSVTIPIK